MRTYESAKGFIPSGATHYRNECHQYHFFWIKYIDSKPYIYALTEGIWKEKTTKNLEQFEQSVKEIPIDTSTLREIEVNDVIYQFIDFDDVDKLNKSELYIEILPGKVVPLSKVSGADVISNRNKICKISYDARTIAVKEMFEYWDFQPKIFDRETDPIANSVKCLLFKLYDAGYKKTKVNDA